MGGGHTTSPAADPPPKPHHLKACPSIQRALAFYTARYVHWSELRAGAPKLADHRGSKCPRYLLKVRRAKAAAAHQAWNRYFTYHWAWSEWLPSKWQRIGACETGYGRRPGSWTWDSGRYVSAFGIYREGYTHFAHEIGQLGWDETRTLLRRYPTPREQYNVALRIYYHYGFSGWGCRNA